MRRTILPMMMMLSCTAILGIDPPTPRIYDAGADAQAEAPSDDATIVCSPPCSTCCGTLCADFKTDKKNCGSCNHDCLGGECSNGKCQPFDVVTGDFPTGLAVDGDKLFYTEAELPTSNHGIQRCTIADNCASGPTLLADNRQWTNAIAIDGTSVYWTEYASVMSCDKTNCFPSAPKAIFAGVPEVDWPYDVAVDGTDVYWTDRKQVKVSKCPKTGCNSTTLPKLLLTNVDSPGIAVDTTSFYVTNTVGSVIKCSASGCPAATDGGTVPTELANNLAGDPPPTPGPVAIAIDDTNVYFTIYNVGVAKCAKAGCGQNPTVLFNVTGQGLDSIAVDKTHVYVSSFNGVLLRCAIDGCNGTPTIMANGILHPRDLVLDDKSIFYAEGEMFRVRRLAK